MHSQSWPNRRDQCSCTHSTLLLRASHGILHAARASQLLALTCCNGLVYEVKCRWEACHNILLHDVIHWQLQIGVHTGVRGTQLKANLQPINQSTMCVQQVGDEAVLATQLKAKLHGKSLVFKPRHDPGKLQNGRESRSPLRNW